MRTLPLIAALALLLAGPGCGRDAETNPAPEGGTVSTTERDETTRVEVDEGTGREAVVETSQDGGSTHVRVQGGEPGAEDAEVTITSEGATAVATTSEGTEIRTSASVDPAHFAVPFYPGAEVVGGGVQETAAQGATARLAVAELVTSDPLEEVDAFYAGKAGDAQRMSTEVDGDRTVVFAPRNPMGGTTVTLTAREGKTHIVLSSHGG